MRYFIGFLVTVGLIILLIVLLFHGGGKSKVPSTSKTLTSYASTNAQVSLTIDGPINATSLHEQIRITADNANVTYEHIKGYDGQVIDTQIFANTENSYDVFLHALLHAGFTKGDNAAALRDERGYCPTGDRYIFELKQDNHSLERYWATTCGKPKTYLGAVDLTVRLFQAQVPGYENLTQGIEL
jgi:hypothetical protein